MSERLKVKNLSFSTADAENIETYFACSTLRLKFSDWQEQKIQVEFSDVIAFSWNQEEIDHKRMSDDCVYEVTDSNWLLKYREVEAAEIMENYKHYKFCFNANGILDVIFDEMKIIKNDE